MVLGSNPSRTSWGNFSPCLDRLCYLSIAHLEAGCVAQDRREKSSCKGYNPSEGCRWKTAVKNNPTKEKLLKQPQKPWFLRGCCGSPCNLSYWEEESKTGRPSDEKLQEAPKLLVLIFWVRSPERCATSKAWSFQTCPEHRRARAR